MVRQGFQRCQSKNMYPLAQFHFKPGRADMVTKVFISYRRKDSSSESGSIRDRLNSERGIAKVFFDTTSINPGDNWPTSIRGELLESDVVLVIIGPNWLSLSDETSGKRLIDRKDDWVREEVKSSLDHNKKIIPVLIRGARIPLQKDLPEDIRKLSRKQALIFNENDRESSFIKLLSAVQNTPPKIPSILLTSTSPRRKLLLEQIGWELEKDYKMAQVIVTLEPDRHQSKKKKITLQEAQEIAKVAACRKIHQAIFHNRELVQNNLNPEETIVIGADTVVYCEGTLIDRPLLKALEHAGPDDIEMAKSRSIQMLSSQRGKKISIITGLAAAIGNNHRDPETVVVTTVASMKNYSDSDILKYIQEAEPFDMAGSFGIQGKGISLFKDIGGSYSNIVGLPLREFVSLLRRPTFSAKFSLPKFDSSIRENIGTDYVSPPLSSLSIGDINYDFMYDELPANFFDQLKAPGEKIISGIYRGAGGTAVQFARGAKHAGFKECFVVGFIGGDALGSEIEEELFNEKIKSLCERDYSQKTSVAIILRNFSRKDISITVTDSCQSLPPTSVNRAARDIESSDVFYCSGYCLVDSNRRSSALEMIRIAKKAKRLVVFDVVVGMSKSFSYENLKSSTYNQHEKLSNVDVFVSELPEVFKWLEKEYDEENILDSWEDIKEEIASELRLSFPISILRTPTYSHEIVISPDTMSEPIELDYPAKSSRERIGYGDRRTAFLVHSYLSPRIVLASKSPQRYELLRQIVAREKIEVRSSNCPENYDPYETPFQRVQRLASEKAIAVFESQNFSDTIEFVIGADTEIICKKAEDSWELVDHPTTSEEAFLALRKLSGKSHIAITGISIIGLDPKSKRLIIASDYVKTEVKFAELEESEISSYVDSREPIGRAGSYAIQGLGALFIEAIEGSYSNVVGLPLERISDIFSEVFDCPIWNFDKVSAWRFSNPIKHLKLEI